MLQIDSIEIEDNTGTPDVDPLTTNSLDGTGVFDKLMKVVKLHLVEEFDNGRITDAQYADVYIGALGIVLPQATQFLLNQQTNRKVAAEIGLVRQKIVTELANTDDTLRAELGFNGTTAVEGLVADQKLINAQQLNLVTAQVVTEGKKESLIGQQIISELGQTDTNITSARAAGHGYNSSNTVDGILKGAADKSQYEADLMEQKVVTELAQTSTTKPAGLGQSASTDILSIMKGQYDLLVSQKDKADKEAVLLAQKTITELAQTSDTVVTSTDALNTSTTVSGVSGKQQTLYTAQSNGFARDAEQKLARMLIDAWSVDATINAATANATNHLADADLGAVIVKAKTGIGV